MRASVLGVIAFLVLSSRSVHGDDEKAACVTEHADAQRAMKSDDFVAAHRVLSQCSRPTCPALLRAECQQWLGEVSTKVPTLVFAARVDGVPVLEVSVHVDGAPVTSMLDGGAFAIAPGEHVLRFERIGLAPIDERVVVAESDRRRPVEVSWTPSSSATPLVVPTKSPAEPRPAPATTHHSTAPAWIFAGVGVAALATFIGFAFDGRGRQGELEAGCAPRCAEADVRAMRRSYLIGDIALAVSVVSFGTSGFFFWRDATSASPPSGVTVAWSF